MLPSIKMPELLEEIPVSRDINIVCATLQAGFCKPGILLVQAHHNQSDPFK
jgi:hypothetical protein